MTMDYGQQSRADMKLSSPRIGNMDSPNLIAAANTGTTDIEQIKLDMTATTTKSPAKRSFDVAFLIRPDENMKHKQARTHSLAMANEQSAFQQHHQLHHQLQQPVHLHHHRQSPDVEDTTTSSSSHASQTPPQPSPSNTLTPPQSHPQHHISVKSDAVLRGGGGVVSGSMAEQTPSTHRYADFANAELMANEMIINRSSYEHYNRAMAVRMPRIYDHPAVAVVDGTKDEQPRSAFTKVPSQHHHQLMHHLHQQSQQHHHHHQQHHQQLRIETPPGQSASPDRLSCPSTSPPVSISPPVSHRSASVTQPTSPMPSPSHVVMAAAAASSPPQQHIMYPNFRPEYRQFVNAAAAAGQFHSISHQLQQAAAASHQMGQQQQKFKQHQQQQHQHQQQQFMYRASAAVASPAAAAAAAAAAIAANAEQMSHINKFMGTPQQFAAVQQHFAAQQQHQQQHHHHQQQQQQQHLHHQQQQHQQHQPHHHQQQQQQHHQHHQQQQHAELAAAAVRHPAAAAALLTSLIPPTLATSFTLTAQNVCAKCNISFRMTSDLVYHMRSHHKSEFTTDTNRRKREEKLKCPVCNESFRERHHLTRHMTAHQDKASDEAPPPLPGSSASSSGCDMGGLHQRIRNHK